MRTFVVLLLLFKSVAFAQQPQESLTSQALHQIRPEAQWAMTVAGDCSTLVWLDTKQTAPTCAQINAAIATLPPPPTPGVPQTVSSAQAKIALSRAGLLTTVQNWVNTQGIETQIAWNAPNFSRNSGIIAIGGVALGITPAQLDALFITAATIQP